MIIRTAHARAALAFALVALLSVAACGGGGGSGDASGDGGAQDGGGAAATPAGQEPTTAPAAGGGDDDVPVIADGTYTAGTAHIEVTGDKSMTVDAPLVPGASSTASGSTLLMFLLGEGEAAVTLTVAVNADPGPAISLASATVFTAGGGDEGCRFRFTRNDASGVAGTFACPGLEGMSAGGAEQATVDVNGTFSADL